MRLTIMEMVAGTSALLVGSTFSGAQAVAEQIAIGGMSLSRQDWLIVIGLSAGASLFSAGFRLGFKDLQAALTNWVLGVVFGLLLAHLAVFALRLPPITFFSMTPFMSLVAANICQRFIHSDNALGLILRIVGGRKGGS